MLRRLHHWIGLLVAAWLAIAAVSGGLLLFKDEYYGWRYPALPDAPVFFEPAGAVIESIVADSTRPITVIGLPTAALPAYHVYYEDGGEALFHPETAMRVAGWDVFDALPAFLFELHVYMLLGEFGHIAIGLLGLAAALNVCIGLALWWRRRSTFRLRFLLPRGTRKKHLIRSHAAQGAVAGVVLVITLLSGSAIVFPDVSSAALGNLLGSTSGLRPTVNSTSTPAKSVDWDKAISAAADRFPEGRLRFVNIPDRPDRPLVLRMKNARELHPNGRTYVVVHAESGEVLESIDATRTGLGPAVFNALYPIHAGKTEWPGYRLLLALMSLLLLYIAASGAYLYLKRPRRPGRSHGETDALRSN